MSCDIERAKDIVVAYWDQVWTQGDPTAPARFYAEQAHENGEPVDVQAFSEAVGRWRQRFPDFTASVDEVLAAEGRILSRVTYRGTHEDTWAGIPASGRRFALMGLDLWRVEDDRIVEHWHVTDHLDLVLQLGGQISGPGR